MATAVTTAVSVLGPPDTSVRGSAAVEDARRRIEDRGWLLTIYPADPAFDLRDEWELVRVSVTEPGFVWDERRSVLWDEPAGEIGHLKVLYASDDTLSATASDPIDWLVNWKGWHAGDDLRSRWKDLHLNARRTPRSALEARFLRVSEWAGIFEPSDEQMRSDLDHLAELYEAEWKSWVAAARQPYVDYINVAPERQRLGVATALYQAAAGWLGERGLTLRASTIQEPAAAAAWSKLASLWGLSKSPVPGRSPDNPADAWVFDLRP